MSVDPPATAAGAPNSRDSILVIGGFLGGLAVTVLIVIAIVVALVMCHCRGDSGNTYDSPTDCKRPIPPPVEALPPRLEVNLAYEQTKRFDTGMTDNLAYSYV